METRKVQVTGGSTYTVSIPKTWATENDVEAGTEIEFHPDGDSLFLTPRGGAHSGTIDITDLSGQALTRAVTTMYVSGFDVIELEGTEITTEQRSTVREAVQGLVGLEVLEDSQPGGRPRPARLLGAVDPQRGHADAPDLAVDARRRHRRALRARDHDLARDVIGRDDDLDRLWLVVSRIFRATLRTPKAAEELGLPARSVSTTTPAPASWSGSGTTRPR